MDQHKVLDVIPGAIVTIKTNKGVFSARKVIVTAGAWTNKLLKTTGLQLPLKVCLLIGLIIVFLANCCILVIC